MQDITALLEQGETTLAAAMDAGRAAAHRYTPVEHRFTATIDTAGIIDLNAILLIAAERSMTEIPTYSSTGIPADLRNAIDSLTEMRAFIVRINPARAYLDSDPDNHTAAYARHIVETIETMDSHLERAQQHLAKLDACHDAETVEDEPQNLDLTATYTVTYPGDNEPTTITPQVKTRVKGGKTLTTVSHLAPLLASQIDAIADTGDRLHTIQALSGAVIVICDTPDASMPEDTVAMGAGWCRDRDTLRTTYSGNGHLPVSAVLDLAAQLRIQLGR